MGMNTENTHYRTNVPARVKSVNGLSWFDARIVALSKSGATLEGRFVQRQDAIVELYVISQDPKIKNHHLLALVVSVEEGTLKVKFI